MRVALANDESVGYAVRCDVLPAGHTDGSITLYGVESGEASHRQRTHQRSIVSLQWVAAPPEAADKAATASATAADGQLPR